MNVFVYDPKAGLKHACTVNAAVAYDRPEMGQVVIFLINEAIEVKSLNYHLLQYCMNYVMMDEVSKFFDTRSQ